MSFLPLIRGKSCSQSGPDQKDRLFEWAAALIIVHFNPAVAKCMYDCCRSIID